MKKSLVCGLASAVMLAGCMTATTNDSYMYRDAPTTRQQKADAMLACEVYATKEVPTSNQTSTTPVYRTPTYTTPVYCNTIGGFTSCTGGQTIGGNIVGGDVVTTDVNLGLRERVFANCMAKKGFRMTPFPIPICDQAQIPPGYVSSKTILHRPVKGACVINGVNGSGSVLLLPEDQLRPNKG